MKIALIGPGIMSIPPLGWGAVEILIWDYYLELKKNNINVDIINPIRKNPTDQINENSEYSKNLIKLINDGNYDFVHIHYDCLYYILPFLNCKRIGITSHYPYIDNVEKHSCEYKKIFNYMCNNNNHYIFALSKKDYEVYYTHSQDKNKIFLLLNGSNHNEIKPINNINEKINYNKSIYLAKIEERKKQEKYCKIQNIDFYGNCNTDFKYNLCYKGELLRKDLPNTLQNYGNLVLLSNGEGTPLVIKEALMAGLPIVTNKHSVSDLDSNLSFIDIIPDEKLNNLIYIQDIIEKNLKKQYLKDEIRNYAVNFFSWEILVKRYLQIIQSIEKIFLIN